VIVAAPVSAPAAAGANVTLIEQNPLEA